MLLVVLFHAQVLAPGGFVGVDVFFVISGYVIGRGLVDGMGVRHAAGLGAFYLRRARRILPPLAVLLVVVILVAPLLAPVGGLPDTSPTGIAAALFSANLYLYRATAGGYFAPAADLNPLLHTWSLSVEEQFYFAIPAILLGAWAVGRGRGGGLRTTRVVVGLTLLGSALLSLALSYGPDTVLGVVGLRFAFFSPFTRAWEFLVGIALVLLPVRWLPAARLRVPLAVIGVLGILAAARLYDGSTVFPGWAVILPVVGAALVVYAGTRPAATGPAPTSTPGLRPFVALGDLSYSWYLWHWPLIVFAAAFWPDAGRTPLVLAAIVSLAPALWSRRALEQRWRDRPTPDRRRTVLIAVVCILAPIVAAVVAIPIRTLVEGRADDSFAAVAREDPHQVGQRTCNGVLPGTAAARRCTFGSGGGPSVALFGDSNAAMFANAVLGAGERTDATVRIATLADCPIWGIPYSVQNPDVTPDRCVDFTEEWVRAFEADPPDVVVLSTATDVWAYRSGITVRDPETGAPVTDPDARTAAITDGIARILRRLEAAGSRTVLVDVVPKPYTNDPRACSNLALIVHPSRCLPDPFTVDAHPQMADANRLQAAAATAAGATTWDFADEVCPGGRCVPTVDGRLVWRDPNHISGTTSTRLVPEMTRALESVLAGTPSGP